MSCNANGCSTQHCLWEVVQSCFARDTLYESYYMLITVVSRKDNHPFPKVFTSRTLIDNCLQFYMTSNCNVQHTS